MEYFLAALSGVYFGVMACHYGQWKVIIGPEEDDPEGIRGRELIGDRIRRGEKIPIRMFSVSVAVMALTQMLLWLFLLQNKGLTLQFLLEGLMVACLACLSYVDIKIMEIPPEVNVIIALLGLVHLVMDRGNWLEYLMGAVLVSGLFLLIGLISSGKAMGLGDVKLMAAAGLFLGWKKILLAMFLGCVLGTVIHFAGMLIFRKGRTLSFGPYLAAGMIIVLFYGDQLIRWYMGYLLSAV